MQAIVTRIQPATGMRGTRVKAICSSHVARVAYDHKLDALGNHQNAAREVARRMKWHGEWTTGEMPNGDMVHTMFMRNAGRDSDRFGTFPILEKV